MRFPIYITELLLASAAEVWYRLMPLFRTELYCHPIQFWNAGIKFKIRICFKSHFSWHFIVGIHQLSEFSITYSYFLSVCTVCRRYLPVIQHTPCPLVPHTASVFVPSNQDTRIYCGHLRFLRLVLFPVILLVTRRHTTCLKTATRDQTRTLRQHGLNLPGSGQKRCPVNSLSVYICFLSMTDSTSRALSSNTHPLPERDDIDNIIVQICQNCCYICLFILVQASLHSRLYPWSI